MTTLNAVEDAMLAASAVMVLLAGALLLYRIWYGPSMLDRAVALDVAAALIIAGVSVKAAQDGDSFYFPVMLVLAFLGFTGSVGIARFIAVRDRPSVRADGREDHR
ncbi:putative membrane protein [Streptomyces ambofaciens ATCC 23877]|uniref:Uncharacterized protein n=2 Tax=Streptomyces ambofaciens TaxID=1889 RepID=A0ABM6B7E8_STRAM|nr:monovalent cation/H+ antiporter complex subunit F [Streptomyces ambofaciens]AKZ59489.1 putative membrane protein [Streptomyces ambofaciens ATCC 23877]ANB09750.1 hypothetical protein SAM40697_5795 [Streptomyces ambofaciens]CAJ88830.1 putative membrane protein [Streptomyces ambofaciens ATCC 23877]